MTACAKKIICAAVTCLAVLAAKPSPSCAYVLEGKHILYLMLEEMKLPGSFLVRQQVRQYDPDTGDEMLTAAETVRFRMPMEFRSEIDAGGLSRVYVASADRSITLIDGRITSETDIWTDYYKNIFWYRSLERLESFLEEHGVDVTVTSLGRFDGGIAFVIGDVYPFESAPQLWVARETFRPLRWLYQARDNTLGLPALEFRYRQWKQFGRIWFPSCIEFYQDQRMIRLIEVETIEPGPLPRPDIFDIDTIRRSHATDDNGAAPVEPESEIRRRIEDFKRIYE